ncbi:MAG TPA: 3,4-dihydroxy-2-butanone-4-phosphate synthase [Candidatus Thermoplasmatota archaeon]|nr:3,4-dihydroxy-2-butanone-4-phosphate synthase [Candidatus Thermoplasmatota archaeon]
MHLLERAAAALRRGETVLLYDADGREGETDLVIASQFATPEAIRLLRTDGGGLLCTTVAPEHHAKLGLPFLADLLDEAAARHPALAEMKAHDLRYDPSKSSFGLTINHRKTFTGIPDADRALTITELARFLGNVDGLDAPAARTAFGAAFRAPGHVILLNGSAGGLARRQGHTELSLELARQAGLVPSTTICEMLDPATGRAMTKKAAQAYAASNGLVFLTGQDVVDAWKTTPPAASAVPRRVPTSAS